MTVLNIIGILIFAILIAVFAVQNAGPVAIKLFFWAVPEIPLVLVIFGTVFCGMVIGFLLGRYSKKDASVTLRLPRFMSRKKPSA